MGDSENNLNKAFELVEFAEQQILNSDYHSAMESLTQALELFHQSDSLGAEKEQALTIIEARIKDLEKRIEESEKQPLQAPQTTQPPQTTKTPQTIQSPQTTQPHQAAQAEQLRPPPSPTSQPHPIGLRPPPALGEEREKLIKLGLKALANSEQLMGQGYLYRAYKSIQYAYSHLAQAQYDATKVENIRKVGHMMAQRLESMGYQLSETEREYTPSFLTTEQRDYIPTGSEGSFASRGGSGGYEPYQPTFLSTKQIDYTLSPSQSDQQRRSGETQPYIPTFAQTDQPDFTETNQTRIPYLQKSAQMEGPYKPTFAQTDQTDFIPISNKGSQVQPGQTTLNQGYTPTFAQVSEGKATGSDEIGVNLSELQSMFAYIEKGEPIPESIKKSSESEGMRTEIPGSPQSSSVASTSTAKTVGISTPFIHPNNSAIVNQEFLEKMQLNLNTLTQMKFEELFDNKTHDLEIRAQEILDKFEEIQNQQEEKKNQVLDFIDLIHAQEKSYDYEGAISSLYKAIGKMNKLLGWADQVLVLYAWMLILKEKKRTQFRHGGNPNDFDLMKINTEFVQIMTDSLNTSKEVAISFIGDDFNQELTARQIYKVKLEDQERLQNQVFEMLDKANLKVLNQQYTQAIEFYNRAVLTLNSLDWGELRQNIEELIIEVGDLQQLQDLSLVKEINLQEVAARFQYPERALESPEKHILERAKEFLDELDNIKELRQQRIAELEEINQKQSDQKYRAFSLIIQAEGLVLSDLYDESIEAYEEALTLLIGAGWAEQIPKIIDRLVKIRQIREEFIHSKQKQYDQIFKRNIERRNFEDSIMHAITKELLQAQSENPSEEKLENIKTELMGKKDEIFDLLSQVEKKVENGQLAEAILQLKDVKALLQKHHWDDQLSFIYDFVSMVQEEQKIRDQNKNWKKQLTEESEQYKQEIQAYVDEQSANISALVKLKLRILQGFSQHINEEMNTAHETLSLLEQAHTHMQRNEFQMAIELFQEIELNFMKLGWNVDMQPCLYNAYAKEKEFKQSTSRWEQASLYQKQAEMKNQYSQKKMTQQQQSALSDVQNLLASLHGNGTHENNEKNPSPESSEISPQASPGLPPKLEFPEPSSVPSKSISSLQQSPPVTMPKEKQPVQENIDKIDGKKIAGKKPAGKKPGTLEELQRMIREAAEKDQK